MGLLLPQLQHWSPQAWACCWGRRPSSSCFSICGGHWRGRRHYAFLHDLDHGQGVLIAFCHRRGAAGSCLEVIPHQREESSQARQLFLPEASFGLRVLSSPASVYPSVCPCVCVCINHLLVRTITHQPFRLESPNLVERRKTPWLRCLLFLGVIDLDLQGQI